MCVVIVIWLSRSQLLECCASAMAALWDLGSTPTVGKPGCLVVYPYMGPQLEALSNGALAKSCCLQQGWECWCAPPESQQWYQGSCVLAAFDNYGGSMFSKSLTCLFSLLLLVTCKMLTANYLNKQCHGGYLSLGSAISWTQTSCKRNALEKFSACWKRKGQPSSLWTASAML